jgi:hypothetical protein
LAEINRKIVDGNCKAASGPPEPDALSTSARVVGNRREQAPSGTAT